MPAITSANKEFFKSHIKTWRKVYTSPLQQINLSDIENVFETTSNSLTIGTQTVKVGLFGGREGDDVLDISSLTNGELLYLPGQVTDYVRLKTGDDEINTIYWYSSLQPRVLLDNNNYNRLYVNETFNLGSKILTVKALGGLLVSVEDGPTYSITHNANQHEDLTTHYFITEGDSITFNITTTNFPNGSSGNNSGNGTLYWNLEGSIDSSDFDTNSGSVYISNNTATITIDSFTDTSNTENDYFRLVLREDSSTGVIVATSDYIDLRDKIISATLTPSVTTINEGGQVTFTVTTVGYDDGTALNYKPHFTSGQANSSDVSVQFGTVTINNGTASFVVTASQDVYEESSETFQYIIYQNTDQDGNSIPLATSANVSVTNTTSYNFAVSASTISEGNSVTYTVNTAGIPNGTSLYWNISSMSNEDFIARNGSFVINNNTGSFTITTKQDFIIENSPETLTVELKASSSGAALSTINTIPNVTVTDTPFTITVTPSDPLTIVESTHDSTSQVSLTLTGTGVPDGTQLHVAPLVSYSEDISFDNSVVTFNNNSATVVATIVRDGRTEGSEQHVIVFRNEV